MHVAAVVVGQQRRGVQVDFGGGVERAEQVGLDTGLEAAHRLGQHLVVQLKTHLQHIAALALAQYLARATYLQVVHGQVEAAAEFFHLLDRVKPLAGVLAQALQVRDHQIGVGLVVAAAHAPTQLVQLRQAELVGPAHDDGVGRRHVDAGLDDRGAQQHVVALGHKVAHHRLELPLGHLAVGHGDAGLGQQFFQRGAAVLDGLDFVVQKVDLPAALELAQNGFADHASALGTHKGLDRQPALRSGRNHRQIAQAFQGHAHGARDGCGGQREHIDLCAHGLHGLFVAHAKAVLLVDDEQPQVFEMRVRAQQLVRAHDDVNRPIGHALERGADLFARAKAAHLGDLDRPLAEAVHQRLVMLLCQERGGRQQRDLLAASDGDKGRTQGNLGFAKTHVATDQPVHGTRADHVLYHRMDGGALVGGLLKAEVVGKGLVVLRRITEGMALAQRSAGVDVEQLGRRVAHLFGRFALRLVPLAAAQAVQGRLVGAHAGVAADQLQLADRHIQRGRVGVLQLQELLQLRHTMFIGLAHVHIEQPAVAADAVRRVHHRVAHAQLAQVFDQRLDVADLFLLLAPTCRGPGRKQLGLGNKVHPARQPAKAYIERGRGHTQRFVAGQKIFQRVKGRGR